MSVGLIACHVGADRYTTRIDAQSTKAFYEAVDSVARLDSSLKRISLATDETMQTSILMQIYSDAQAAETALSVLPVELDSLGSLAHHINLIGDYAYAVSGVTGKGETLPEEICKQLSSFAEIASDLTEQLIILRQAVMDQAVSPEHYDMLTDSLQNLERDADVQENILKNELCSLTRGLKNPEPVYYDGKFCDHTNDVPAMLKGQREISTNEARSIAAEFLSVDEDALAAVGKIQGDIECWRFETVDEGFQTMTDVSVSGGYIVRFLSDRDNSRGLPADAAESVLRGCGCDRIALSNTDDNSVFQTKSCIPMQNDVFLYPDQVAIQVSDNSLISMDLTSFIKNHHIRDLSVFDQDNAYQQALPQGFTVQQERNAVISSPGGGECFCKCVSGVSSDNLHAVIIIDLQTGKQVQLLLDGETLEDNQ